jgi:hypothetical protein
MSDKPVLRKLIHDLSNKIMILEGYLSIVKIKPEFDIKQIISKLEKNVASAVAILENMREFVRQDDDETELVSLLYSSKIKIDIADITLESELEKIEQSAISHNADSSITGYLLYMDGYFIQYIEGSTKDVEKLYLKITLDTRHNSITLLSHEKIAERAFKKWTNLYRMNVNDHSQVPDALKAIVGEKQRLLTTTESLSLINFVSLISDNNHSKVEGDGSQ